jgi:hypothetical protein
MHMAVKSGLKANHPMAANLIFHYQLLTAPWMFNEITLQKDYAR